MRSHSTRLTLTALLVLCIASALAFSHGPSAMAETAGLTVGEYAETTGSSNDAPPDFGNLPFHPMGSAPCGSRQTGVPGIPQRVLQIQHHLTRFPILPQGPPLRT